MPRGEEQKPVNDNYRNGWDAVFGKDTTVQVATITEASRDAIKRNYNSGGDEGPCSECGGDPSPANWGHASECSFWDDAKKAPPVKVMPCSECRGIGRCFNDQCAHCTSWRCDGCGGEGVIPLET